MTIIDIEKEDTVVLRFPNENLTWQSRLEIAKFMSEIIGCGFIVLDKECEIDCVLRYKNN